MVADQMGGNDISLYENQKEFEVYLYEAMLLKIKPLKNYCKIKTLGMGSK